MCDSYKINVNLFPTFSYFYLHSAFSRACNRFAKRRSRITGSLHTLLSRLFVPVPNTHHRLPDCFHATVPLSAYVGFKCHFSASAFPVVRIAVRQMLARNLRLFHELGAGVGFEPTMSYASLQPSLVAYTVAFDHSANPPDSFYIFSKFYLNNFISSYNPSAMFFAI